MIIMDLVITMEALNSVVIHDVDFDTTDSVDGAIGWIHDPLGFVHPEGPFFDP